MLVLLRSTFEKRPLSARRSPQVFAGVLERDALRQRRSRSRRNTLIVSLLIHGLAVLSLVGWSLWNVDELWTPSVEVKVFSPSTLPQEAKAAIQPSRAPE